jgi:hypothetical protein
MKGKIFCVLSFSAMCFLFLSAIVPQKTTEVSTKISTLLSSIEPTEKWVKAVVFTEKVKQWYKMPLLLRGGEIPLF